MIYSMNDLVRRLERYRLEHKISQKKLADILGVAFVTVNRWFNGHTKPNKIQDYHIQKLVASKRRKK